MKLLFWLLWVFCLTMTISYFIDEKLIQFTLAFAIVYPIYFIAKPFDPDEDKE